MTFLYANNEREERDMKKAIPFTILPQKIKYLGISITKEVKDLYKENYKTLLHEIKEDVRKWKHPLLLARENQHCQNGNTPQSIIQIQCNPCKDTHEIFQRTGSSNPEIDMEQQTPTDS